MPSAPAKTVTVTDDDALTIKTSRRGFRIMRGSGPNRPFVFVRPSEVTNLCDLLIDAFEKESNTK
jgi:hypothetical protein